MDGQPLDEFRRERDFIRRARAAREQGDMRAAARITGDRYAWKAALTNARAQGATRARDRLAR